MSVQPKDDDEGFVTLGVDAQEMDRYADLTLENDETLIYDRDDEDAWIQAEFAIRLDMML